MTDARSPMRTFRAALFAAVCVALAAAGHSSMSAHDIPFPALIAAFGVTAGVGWLAGGQRRGVVTIGTGVLAVQGALHLIFSGGQSAAQHMHPQHQQAYPQPYDPAFTGIDADTGMLLVHLVAGAFCALWLARGESAFFRLARAVGALAFTPLRLLLTTVVLPEAPRPVPAGPRAVRPPGVLLAHVLHRRGPPALSVPRATALGAAV